MSDETASPAINKRRFGRNMAFNLITAIVPVLVTFVTSPIYLHLVGTARYGMVLIAWSLVGYFGFMDLGLSRATANALARIAHEDAQEARIRTFWSSLLINAGLGTLGGLILLGVGYYLVGHVIHADADVRREMLRALPFVAAMLPVSLMMGVGVGAHEAHERFGWLNIMQTGGMLMGQAGPLATAALFGPSLMVILPTLLVVRTVTCVGLVVHAMVSTGIPFKPVLDVPLVRKLLSFGGWVTLTNLVSPLMTDIDQFVIGSLRNVAMVPFYSVPMNLITRTQLLPITLTRTLFPVFSRVGVREAMDLLRTSMAHLSTVMTVVFIILCFLAEPFLRLWMGAQMGELGGPVLRIFTLGACANSLGILFYTALQGQGRPRVVATAHMCEVIPYLALMFPLVKLLGLPGAAIAWAIRMVADAAILGWAAGIGRRDLRPVALSIVALGIVLTLAPRVAQSWAMAIPAATAGR